MPSGDSFLPRIQSVFYATFDETIGPKIVYQVPEGLIASQIQASNGNDSIPSSPSPEASVEPPTPSSSTDFQFPSRGSSSSLVSPTDFYRRGRQYSSPRKRSMSSHRTLFNFNEISKFVIPSSALCGRLVICSTRRHRIIGFPVELTGKYRRHYFRYNLCFVFERTADLSCYEPVVRKISRVLKSCEEESGFLSSAETSPQVHSILEQLYEDLNSYSETSIPIDQFNSIELKIFPFYPNPPEVKDSMVPLALINLAKRYEENWDLTMIKTCRYIDGVNHVHRIAQLADCDIRLTRQAISHLLYYQVIMTIDIFQYSNMYSLCKSIQWLADEMHVKDECGPYVAKNGCTVPDWPDLLHLYSRFKTGKTVFEWMREYHVEPMGIDIRRFITFGVVKGFLRRIHRYPVFIQPEKPSNPMDTPVYSDTANSTLMRKRAKSLQGPILNRLPSYTYTDKASHVPATSTLFHNHNVFSTEFGLANPDPTPITVMSATRRPRRPSAAEKFLEQLRNRSDVQKSAASGGLHSPRASWVHKGPDPPFPTAPSIAHGSVANSYTSSTTATSYATVRGIQGSPSKPTGGRDSRRTSMISPTGPPPSPVIPKANLAPSRPRAVRSPSAHYQHYKLDATAQQQLPHPYPPQLVPLLDGEHNTDEIGVKLGCGWPQLETWLAMVGGGQGQGDLGDVVIIYR